MRYFDEEGRHHDDWSFCLRLEAEGAEFALLQTPLTVWNWSDDFEHAGSGATQQFEEQWLARNQGYLSEQAQTAFVVSILLPHWNRARVNAMASQYAVLQALRHRLITPRRALRLTRRIWQARLFCVGNDPG